MSAPGSSEGSIQEKGDEGEFKPWRCGDEYQHMPMNRGSDPEEHWKTVAEHLMEREKGRCEAWKDEVDKLLVFAGLFSAVVTGLLIESYKSLTEYPIEALLTKIVDQGTNQTSIGITATGGPRRFVVPESSKRVNALWFLSLVLSLATALFGIVAQQWLREHTRASPQNTHTLQLPAQIQMQADALNRLALFLVGLADFVWALNHQIAIPVLIASIFVFAFLLFTTLYPALQSLPCQIPRSRNSSSPSTPCPYKSPQSWACFKAVLVVKQLLDWPLWRATCFLSQFPSLGIITEVKQIPFDQLKKGWINHAALWLRQRDIDILKFHADRALLPLLHSICYLNHSTVSHGIYDTVASLQTTKSELSLAKSNKLPHVFQCLQDLTTTPNQSRSLTPLMHNIRTQYLLTKLLCLDGNLVTPRPFDGFTPTETRFAVDNARLWFILEEPGTIRAVTPHHLELLVRVLSWLVEHAHTRFELPASRESRPSYIPFPTATFLSHTLDEISESLQRNLQSQFEYILLQFFENASTYRPPADEIGQTLLTTSYLLSLLQTADFLWRDSASFCKFKSTLLPKLVKFFTQVQEQGQYQDNTSNPAVPGLEFLLVSVAIFLNELAPSSNALTPEEEHTIFQTLKNYNEICDQAYVRTLLESVLYYDYRVWPTEFIDQHLSDDPDPESDQARLPTDSASKHHISVDFLESASPGVHSPSLDHHEDDPPSQRIGKPNTNTETGTPQNGNPPIMSAGRAWRSPPVSLRYNKNHFDLDVWDASL